MRKLIVIFAFVVVGALVWSNYRADSHPTLEPTYAEPYVILYGRKSDAATVRLQTKLRDRNYRYRFVDLDVPGAADALVLRLRAASLDAESYPLPVVEVNARLATRPEPEWIDANYRIDHNGKKL